MFGRTVRGGALLLTLTLGWAASGCARALAKTTPDAPLDVPVPPPRVVDAEAPTLVSSPDEPARRAPVRPRPTPPRPESRPEPAKAEAPTKPEPLTSEPPKIAEEPPKPAAPPTTLQTVPAASEGDVERSIRATLARATSDLNRVDYRVLNADARTQYDTAKRFIEQAEDAVRTKNLVFARNLGDKAATLAAQLAAK